MEKERFFAASWHSSSLELKTGVAASVDQLPEPPFLNLAWEQQPLMNRDPPFESAFSSLVSSPSSNPPAAPNDSNVIHELIGRLDSICNSGEATPTSSRCHSAHTSCYSTPLNSPPKLNLAAMDIQLQTRGGLPVPGGQMAVVHFAPFAADPGFAERAARFSCFGGRSFGGLDSQFALPEAGKLSRVSSSQSLKAVGNAKDAPMADPERVDIEARSKFGGRTPGPSTPDEPEFAHGKEATSASDRATVGGPKNNVSKRKSAPKAKTKQAHESAGEEHPDAKRSKPVDVNGFGQDSAVKPKTEQNGDAGEKQGTENNNAKLPEPPKDYIHVRARRGQATDSHSLAERVRREKISERMKFLQDLVPGCNRLTGKAVMLDEIINYVQSLQRQVEFLSMKLAALNPQLDTNAENLVPKDIHEGHVPPAFSQQLHQLDLTSAALSYAQQPLQGIIGNAVDAQGSLDALDSLVHRCPSLQVSPLYGFSDGTSQLGNLWVDDLNYVVQTGFAQSQGTTAFSSQGLQAE